MLTSLSNFLKAYDPLESAIELAIIWIVVYLLFRFLEGTRGAGVLRGLALLAIVVTVGIRVVAGAFDKLERLGFIYDKMMGILAILLIVVFQPELRQGMVRLGEVFTRGRRRTSELYDEVGDAVSYLSRNQFGAILVFERAIQLGASVEGGVRLDAVLSSRLLQSIFYPNNPLHDLAVVVRGERVVAANAQLPLADVGLVPAELGSRHRAAVGVTMESDCLVVVVSEERGTIRFAERGRLSPPVPRDEFRREFERRLSGSAFESGEFADAAAPGGSSPPLAARASEPT